MDIFGVYLKQDVKVNAGCENLVKKSLIIVKVTNQDFY